VSTNPEIPQMGWTRDDSLSEEENERRLKELLASNLTDMKEPNYPDPMLPPWAAHPDYAEYSMYSMGWRMGSGEDYMCDFRQWFDALSEDVKQHYIETHSEPDGWDNWWVLVTQGYDAFKALKNR